MSGLNLEATEGLREQEVSSMQRTQLHVLEHQRVVAIEVDQNVSALLMGMRLELAETGKEG